MSETYLSLKPSDAIHGGGMVPEGRYKITDAKPAMWDYAGTQPTASPALGVEFTNPDGAVFAQYYTAGDARNVKLSADGERFVPAGSTSGLNDGTNLYVFMKAMVNAGIPEDELDVPMRQLLVGMDVEVIHEVTQEREIKGTKKPKGAIPVIGKIYGRPGDTTTATAPGKKAAAAKKPNGAGAAVDADVAGKAQQLVVTALKSAEGRSLEKKVITSAVFKILPPNEVKRTEILNLCIQDEFLTGLIASGALYDAEKAVLTYIGD